MTYSAYFRSLVCTLTVGVATAIGAPKIGVVLKGRTAFWAEMEKGAQEAAQKSGAELVVKAPPTEDNVGIQIRLVEAVAAEGITTLIVAPTDQKALAAPVAALAQKGVKVIAVDSPLAGKDHVAFVGTDQEAAGVAAGKLIASLIQAADEVAFFKASETQSGGATEQRESGAAAALRAAYPNVALHGNFFAGGDPAVAATRAGQLLARYPNVKVVFASSSVGTMSMLHVLQERKLAGAIKLVGFGYNLNPEVAQAIESGALTGWMAQLPREVGRKAVETALAVAKGETAPPVVHTDYLVITRANLKDANVQALLTR